MTRHGDKGVIQYALADSGVDPILPKAVSGLMVCLHPRLENQPLNEYSLWRKSGYLHEAK